MRKKERRKFGTRALLIVPDEIGHPQGRFSRLFRGGATLRSVITMKQIPILRRGLGGQNPPKDGQVLREILGVRSSLLWYNPNMDDEDKKLIDEYLSGDNSTFEKLVKKYLKPIYNFTYQLTKDRTQAEDLTQDTFIKAWKNIKKFDKTKSFKTWLFVIARNSAFDYFKKKKAIPFSSFEADGENNKLEEIAEDCVLPDKMAEIKDLEKQLETKIRKIPEKYSIILLLRYKDDFTLKEIAEIVRKPYNTVKVYHQRGLKELKKVFDKK